MKAGIVTFTYGCNYGQRLQNFAVQNILEENGYSAYTLRQKPPFSDFLHLVNRSFRKLKNPYKIILNTKRQRRFNSFDRKYIHFFNKIISEQSNIYSINQYFDIFVAGSDQIWNPFSCDVNSIYFLQFAPKEKRITLAPSFSVDHIPEEKKDMYSKYLKDISNISVREYRGAEIIYELCGKKAAVILDPTLMISANVWEKISKRPSNLPKGKYVLLYFLSRYEKQKIMSWVGEKNLYVIDLIDDPVWYSTIGPEEFLYLIHNAEIVFTDSYHGTIFSVLFHKQVRNFIRISGDFSMQSRFDTLYSKLGLPIQIVTNHLDFETAFDYCVIDKKLLEERKKTKAYIEKVLNV